MKLNQFTSLIMLPVAASVFDDATSFGASVAGDATSVAGSVFTDATSFGGSVAGDATSVAAGVFQTVVCAYSGCLQ